MKHFLLATLMVAAGFTAYAGEEAGEIDMASALPMEAAAISEASAIAESSAEASAVSNQEIEEKLTTWQKIMAKMPKISGYLQTGFNWNTLAGYGGHATASFQAKRLRLIMDGTITDKASFRLQLEAFNGIGIGVSGPNTIGLGKKNITVMDAFATYKFCPQFAIRAGIFYTPVGYENYDISPATLETIDFSNICYRMACRNAVGYDIVDYGRDLGIMLMGDLAQNKAKGFSYLSYNLAVTNGHMPLSDDNNKSKDIIAALTIRPVKDLNIKLAYNYGEYKPWNPDSPTFQGITNYHPMNRFVIGAWYNNPNGLDLRAEFGRLIAGKYKNMNYSMDGNTYTHNSSRPVDEIGFYVLAAYRIKGYRWLPVIRYDLYHDRVNPNSANNYNRGLVGFTYQPHRNVKIQANYLLSFYKDSVADAVNRGRKTSSQLQVMGLFLF